MKFAYNEILAGRPIARFAVQFKGSPRFWEHRYAPFWRTILPGTIGCRGRVEKCKVDLSFSVYRRCLWVETIDVMMIFRSTHVPEFKSFASRNFLFTSRQDCVYIHGVKKYFNRSTSTSIWHDVPGVVCGVPSELRAARRKHPEWFDIYRVRRHRLTPVPNRVPRFTHETPGANVDRWARQRWRAAQAAVDRPPLPQEPPLG